VSKLTVTAAPDDRGLMTSDDPVVEPLSSDDPTAPTPAATAADVPDVDADAVVAGRDVPELGNVLAIAALAGDDGEVSPVEALVAEAAALVPAAVEQVTAGLLAGDEQLLATARAELDRARTLQRQLQRAVRDATGEVGPGSPDRVLGLACERLGALAVRALVLLTRVAEAAPDATLHRRSAPVRDAVAALGATVVEAHRTAASAAVGQAGGLRDLVELDRTAGRLRGELLDAVANAPTKARSATDTIGRCYERIADTAISVGAEHATILGVSPDERRRRVLRSLRGR
jgi:phosphate uptake regulator